MQDENIPCAEAGCTEVRVFTVGEQEFFSKKNFNKPKYCKTHSEQKKRDRENRNNSPFKPTLDKMRKDSRHDDGDFNNGYFPTK